MGDEKVTEQSTQDGQRFCRDGAWQVFIRRAERLEKRAMGYRAIAHLIKTGGLTEAEDQAVWTVGAFEER